MLSEKLTATARSVEAGENGRGEKMAMRKGTTRLPGGPPRQNAQRDFQSLRRTRSHQAEAGARRRDGRMWDSPFARFVDSCGVLALAARLGIDPSAVSHWIAGRNQPRASVAFQICELAKESGIPLSFEEVYSHARKPRDAKIETGALASTQTPALSTGSERMTQSKPIETCRQSQS